MRQVPSTLSDRKLWGRMVDGYAKASGTGRKRFDSEANLVNSDGSIWMLLPLEEFQLREIWEGCGLSTTAPESTWHRLSAFERRYLQIAGLKIRKGFWAGEVWLGCLALLLDNEQVNAGWIAAKNIEQLFATFDRWFEGEVRSMENATIAASSV